MRDKNASFQWLQTNYGPAKANTAMKQLINIHTANKLRTTVHELRITRLYDPFNSYSVDMGTSRWGCSIVTDHIKTVIKAEKLTSEVLVAKVLIPYLRKEHPELIV